MENFLADYFEYLIGLIEGPDRLADNYYELLENLFLEEFWWVILRDENRAKDGLGLRSDFCRYEGWDSPDIYGHLDGRCSILEMMIALAKRCDSDLMYDFDEGDRTYKWFWEMIDSLGLGDMVDGSFDYDKFIRIIDIFLNRTYGTDGNGGLFYVKNCQKDLTKMEIWDQLNCYVIAELGLN